MTRISTTVLLLLCCLPAIAQAPYGNEWIDYEKPYLRIPVSETGIYKITAADLAHAGVALDSVRISGIRLFVHGAEIPVEVVGDASGCLGRNGYVLFAGKRNDGLPDTSLYTRPQAMPHSHYNLYSDTTAYFLSWFNSGPPGLRAQFPKPGTVIDSAAFHWERASHLYNSHYLPGQFYPKNSNYDNGSLATAYDEGEGWTGPEITRPFEIEFQTTKLFKIGPREITCEFVVAGWAPGQHHGILRLGNSRQTGRKLVDFQIVGREVKRVTCLLRMEDFDETGNLALTLLPEGEQSHFSVSYAQLAYPQAGPRVAPAYKPIALPRMVRFNPIDPNTAYLIITHPLMRVPAEAQDPVSEYVRYRSSPQGGAYQTTAIDSQELYDQFNAGQPGPGGIRNAIRFLHDTGQLKFVLLAGKSVDPQKARKSKDAWQLDMVPNAGWPGSDLALATGRASHVPLVPVGRINARNSSQLLHYLKKVQAMEAEAATAAWRYRILHLSGGRSRDELSLFKNYMQSFTQQLQKSPLSGRVTSISKLTDSGVESVNIDKQVNAGVGLITLFGHSGLDVTDIDIGKASDPARNYLNAPRFPAVIVNGCAAGSIFYSDQTLSSDWIFARESGAVLFLAHTFNAPSTALKRYTEYFYKVLADTAFLDQPFGEIQLEAIRRNMSNRPGMLDSITVQQIVLHGDPAIRLFPGPFPPVGSQDVVPGQPPVLWVTFNGRQISDGELIDPNSLLKIRMFDDNLPNTVNDTTLLAIWLKEQCTGCTDIPLRMQEARGENVGGAYYEITLPLKLTPGTNNLTIQCRDKQGNSSPPYQIRFQVPATGDTVRVRISPNPFARWFRLRITNESPMVTELEMNLRNNFGTTVFRKVLQCHTGTNEWFVSPEAFGARLPAGLPAGIYHYSITSAGMATGRALYLEGSSGHLFYSP